MSRHLKPTVHWGSRAWSVLVRSAAFFVFLSCSCAFADLNADTYGCSCSGTECACSDVESNLDSGADSSSDSGADEVPSTNKEAESE